MKWSEEEILFLTENYPKMGKKWCCIYLKRSDGAIRYMASLLNLKLDKSSDFFMEFQKKAANSKVGKKRPGHSELMKSYYLDGKLSKWVESTRIRIESGLQSKISSNWIANNGHPKGFLGGVHSESSKLKMSNASKNRWADPGHIFNSESHKQKLSDNMIKRHKDGVLRKGYSRGRQGTYNINGSDMFFRSLWEANYALYLDWLISIGEIKKWEYEVDVFWFEKIKRGVRSYKPDFKIFNNDESISYHEVKGYMDDKSKTKLNRMRIYYPKITLVLIDQKAYKRIISRYGSIVKFFK